MCSDTLPPTRTRSRPTKRRQLYRSRSRAAATGSDVGADREGLPPADGGRPGLHGAVVVDLPIREPGEDLVERDASPDAGQGRSEAEVKAVPEAQVVTDLAVDVEAVPVGVNTLDIKPRFTS